MTQRLRITYAKAGALQYVAHLDLMRLWERTFRRAGLPLAYSEGFSPHPRLSLGAPLSVGAAGERELLDVWMVRAVDSAAVSQALDAVLPDGMAVVAVAEIDPRAAAIQAVTRGAHYEVTLEPSGTDLSGGDPGALRERIAEFLALDSLDWEEQRGEKLKRYDIRAAVNGLTVREQRGRVVVAMDLGLNERATRRPLAVLAALGVTVLPLAVVRLALVLVEPDAGPTSAPERATGGAEPAAEGAA